MTEPKNYLVCKFAQSDTVLKSQYQNQFLMTFLGISNIIEVLHKIDLLG